MMTISPNREKELPVSMTMRPFTQTAEVAVKKASRIPTDSPVSDAWGRESRTVPARIRIIKMAVTSWGGLILFLTRFR
ncbi:hypothetical protein D3C76_1743680 [compost metagenome]